MGARRSTPARLAVAGLFWLVVAGASPGFAQYAFEALGTFDGLAAEPAAINDLGQVCGTLTGT